MLLDGILGLFIAVSWIVEYKNYITIFFLENGGKHCPKKKELCIGPKSKRKSGILLVCWFHYSFYYLILIIIHYLSLLVGSAISCGIGYWYYVEHLEMTPITGRKRFSIVSSQQIKELSQTEFQMVQKKFPFMI